MERKLSRFIQYQLEDDKKIIFIDLAYAENTRGNIDIHLGIKEKVGGFIGTVWRDAQLDVEDDFSILEFQTTCEKYNISYSVFSGDNDSYILKRGE
jgi:hypothetical protein